MIYVNARFFSQPITGVQRFAVEISKQLAGLRGDIVFLVPVGGQRQVPQGLKVKEIGRFNGHLWEQFDLPMFLKRKKSSILLSLTNTGPIFFRNQVVTHHDVSYLKFPASYSLGFRLFYRTISPWLLRSARVVLTVSDFSKSEISSSYKLPSDKLRVVYNAVSDQFSTKCQADITSPEIPYILSVSSPSYHKNFGRLISAFERSKASSHIKLKIVGSASGGLANGFRDESGVIDWLGRVSDQRLAELYSGAIAFAFPSLYEGFGIPPLEAQACGCAVISSNAASLPEVLGKGAYYFDPYSIGAIAEAIDWVYDNPSVRQDLVERGRENIKRFSWGESATKINLVLNELAKSR